MRQVGALVERLKVGETLTREEVQDILHRIESDILHICQEAEEVERASIAVLARRRMGILVITALIELGVALAISPFEKTISKFAAVYVFSPLVSAVAGNHGLQTAAIIIRAMAVGTLQDKVRAVLREVGVGLLCGLGVGLFAGLIAFALTGMWVAVPAITLSLLAGMMTSGLMGAVIPQVMHWLGYDPALVAGPAETALQDLSSYFTFLAALSLFSKWM